MLQNRNNFKNINEYKIVLILKYFKLVNASYSYNELMDLFGLNIKQLDSFLNDMIEMGLLEINQYIKVTHQGEGLLKKYNMNNFDELEEDIELNIFCDEKMGFEDIYIPDGFDKKLKKLYYKDTLSF